MQIQFRKATLEDVPLLAQMNQQLIIDESSRNNMTPEQLETRLRGWLANDRRAVLIVDADADDAIMGYLLYRVLDDEYYPYRQSIYVRQYFIKPTYRRRGIGQIAFEAIAREYFPAGSALMLDVLESNPEAKQFWLKMGFEIYRTTMRREPDES